MEVRTLILSGVPLLYLLLSALIDVRKREIPVALPAIAFAVGVLLQLFFGEVKLYELLPGCIPGCALILLSFATRQAVGLGDGLTFLALGVYLSLPETLLLLLIALTAAAAFGGILIAMKKKKKKEELPFLPFVLAGYVVLLFIV